MSTHFWLAGAAFLCVLVLNIVWRWWLLRKYRISSGVSLNRQVRSRFMFRWFAQPAQYVARKQSIVLDGPERIHRSCVHPSPQRWIENYHPDVRCDSCSYVVTIELVPICHGVLCIAVRYTIAFSGASTSRAMVPVLDGRVDRPPLGNGCRIVK